MDVTEVALHQVTDDFIGHIRAMGTNWDLDQVTEFLVIAATLLDLKAARLLPDATADTVGDDDMFQARDLLFARLLAYRAYQQVSALFAELEAGALRRYPRAVTLEARYLGLLPEIRIGLPPDQFAEMAASVFRPKPPPTVNLDHLHASPVSVAAHTAVLRVILTDRGTATFGELVAGCTATLEVVARFLGLLNLYRESAVAFDQPEPLGTLTVRSDRTVDPGTGRRNCTGHARGWLGVIAVGRGVRVNGDPHTMTQEHSDAEPPVAVTEMVPDHDLVGALEAVLLVVDAPVTEVALATAVGHRPARVRELLIDLAAHYTAASSGIELRELGGGWRFYTRDRFAPVVERFVMDGAQSRLSRAALETLAVVAYRQPVTRARVAGVRGVNVDGVIRTLMSRGLVEDVGTDPDTGGALYRTTDVFLERLGLSDLSELPSLGPLLPEIDGIDDV